jgi:predicted transcriptional regulator
MEVHFSPEKEARLQEAAGRAGKDPVQMVEEAVDRMLEYDSRFLEAVEQGRASERRGDLLDHDAVVARVEQLFRS